MLYDLISLGADLPAPTPDTGEVLVRVDATSVNPVDNASATGMLKDMVPHNFPSRLGRDFAGTSSRSATANSRTLVQAAA